MKCNLGSVPALLVLAALLPAACRPALDDRPWLARALEIVGWKAEPAEARPGTSVTFRLAALDPAGAVDTSPAAWAFCHVSKPVDEERVVSPDCLSLAAPAAVGDPVTLPLPIDACQLYGPDVAQPAPGAPPTRPRDPDVTGGYFQPLAIGLGDALAIGLARVTCDLPDASLQVARAFQAAYVPNRNPTLTSLVFLVEGQPVDPGQLLPGSRVIVQAAWSAGDAESYARYDRQTATVVEDIETLTASWYVTGGTLEQSASVIVDPSILSATTAWQIPTAPAMLQIVAVLRDSRGGSDFLSASFTIDDGPILPAHLEIKHVLIEGNVGAQ